MSIKLGHDALQGLQGCLFKLGRDSHLKSDWCINSAEREASCRWLYTVASLTFGIPLSPHSHSNHFRSALRSAKCLQPAPTKSIMSKKKKRSDSTFFLSEFETDLLTESDSPPPSILQTDDLGCHGLLHQCKTLRTLQDARSGTSV